jgi:hypothetical protein
MIRRPGAMDYAIRHRMDRRAHSSRQVEAVMEVPAISIDTRPEGCVQLVWRGGALAEGPEEVRGALSARSYWLTSVSGFVAHLSPPFSFSYVHAGPPSSCQIHSPPLLVTTFVSAPMEFLPTHFFMLTLWISYGFVSINLSKCAISFFRTSPPFRALDSVSTTATYFFPIEIRSINAPS